jgi:hypothetical protein
MLAEDAAEELTEVLISTEYGAAGEVRRIGLELYRDEEGMALRVAADAIASAAEDEGGLRRLRVGLALRLGGIGGAGTLEVVTRR